MAKSKLRAALCTSSFQDVPVPIAPGVSYIRVYLDDDPDGDFIDFELVIRPESAGGVMVRGGRGQPLTIAPQTSNTVVVGMRK